MSARKSKVGAVMLGMAVVLGGCNAVLGIHQTLDEVWDGGAVPSSTSMSTTSSQNSSYMNPLMTGDGAPPPPPADAGSVTHWVTWPVPNPPNTMLPHPQVYDTSTVGIVRDTVTMLQWQSTTDGVTRDYNSAVAYCPALTASGGGWRLPSRMELLTIVDYTSMLGINNASFGALPVTDTGAERFWSASLKAGDNSSAWTIDFGTSVDLVLPEVITTPLLVRCVRGGT